MIAKRIMNGQEPFLAIYLGLGRPPLGGEKTTKHLRKIERNKKSKKNQGLASLFGAKISVLRRKARF